MQIMIYAIIESRFIDNSIYRLLDSLSLEIGVAFDLVTHNSLSAIISREYDKSRLITKDILLRYAGIIDKLSQAVSLLPMRYGSALPSCSEVVTLLQCNSDSFLDTLNKINNKDEYSFRVLFSSEHQSAFSEDNIEVAVTFPGVLLGDSENKKYLRQKFKTHAIEEKRLQYIENIRSVFISALHAVTHDFDFNKTVSSAIIFDAVLLVERLKRDELLSLVRTMQSQYPDHNLILTGPWPPYSFSQIKTQ